MARRLFPLADRVILTRPHSERALPPDSLLPLAAKFNRAIEVVEDPGNALRRALSLAGEEDLVCAAGSLYLVGEIKRRHRIILRRQNGGSRVREPGDRDGVERC
jgi:dihydrofolate synthase/folylpolyglutamate synthase